MRVRVLPALLTGLALVIAGCGGRGDADGGAGTSTTDAAAADGAGADATDVSGPDAGGAAVGTASTELGDVLVADDGMTLYVFDPDEQGASTCYDDCAAAWPPLTTDGEPTAEGDVDASMLGTTERDDGALQVTYDGWPLYRWASDEAPGDTTGQGVQGVWWVINGDGEPVRDAADAEPASGGDEPDTDTGGY